jgi:hypothetical protein
MLSTFMVLLVVGLYAGVPTLLIWGWVRWARRTQPLTPSSILSLIGFAFATASSLLASSSALYANVIRRFPFYDPSLLRIFAVGTLLSLCAILFAIIGIWRPNPLRWHAPACAVGTLLFWLLAAAGE